MRSRLFGRLGTAAAIVLAVLALGSARVQGQEAVTAPGTGTVTFHVYLPTAGAQLWMAGTKKAQTGTSRTFTVAELPLGRSYSYVFKAVWSRDGRIIISDTRNVSCRAGNDISIDFRKPNPHGTLVEVVPDKLAQPATP